MKQKEFRSDYEQPQLKVVELEPQSDILDVSEQNAEATTDPTGYYEFD